MLDVACGRGRNAVYLVARGCRVHGVDRDPAALAAIAHPAITTAQVDLETSPPPSLGEGLYDAVIVFHYLHRPLFPSIVAAVRAGGVVIYETFTRDQAARGHPRNPAFLLQPGELPALLAPLRIVRAREGDFEGRYVASVVAIR